MILTMPRPQMLQTMTMTMATRAIHQVCGFASTVFPASSVEVCRMLLSADADRFRPMAMMIGPVTTGGK